MPTSRPRQDSIGFKPEDIASGDPFLQLLVKTNISPLLFGLLFVVVFYVARLLSVGHFDYMRSKGDVMGFLDDPAMYTNAVVGFVIMAYYVWMPQGIATLFAKLKANGVVGNSLRKQDEKGPRYQSLDELTRALPDMFAKRWWALAAFVLATGAAFIFLLPTYLKEMKGTVWWGDNFAGALLATMWVQINLYFVLVVLFYVVLSLYWLIQIFSHFEVNIRPLNPDRAGGLAPLGSFALTLSYAISALGMLLVATPITRHYIVEGSFQFKWSLDIILGMGIYATVAPFVFFAPLSVAHNAMKEAKDDLLLQIARRFEYEYDQIQNALGLTKNVSGKQSFDLGESLEKLNHLKELHQTTSEFPVWPFNTQNITRFTTSFVSPLAFGVIADLLSRVL